MAHASALLIVRMLQFVVFKGVVALFHVLRLLLNGAQRLAGFLCLEYIKCDLPRFFKNDQFLFH